MYELWSINGGRSFGQYFNYRNTNPENQNPLSTLFNGKISYYKIEDSPETRNLIGNRNFIYKILGVTYVLWCLPLLGLTVVSLVKRQV